MVKNAERTESGPNAYTWNVNALLKQVEERIMKNECKGALGPDKLFIDACHPSPLGHKLIAELLTPPILQILEAKR